MTNMVRQGDVLVRRVTAPKNQKDLRRKEVKRENGRVVLAHGEATGHAHAIHEPRVRMFRDDALGRTLMKVEETAKIVHEEHDTIELDPGWYEVVRQSEFTGQQRGEGWSPSTTPTRYVAD